MAEETNPKLFYWPIAGRGELTRLIALVGGVKCDEINDTSEAGDLASFGSPGTVPVLQHGDLKLSQSIAIQEYMASIAPKFADLTPVQKAKDSHFACMMEDVIQGFAKTILGDKNPENLKAVMDKWFPLFEGLIPESGFVNGLDFPTMADLAILTIAEGFTPFGASFKLGGQDYKTYPKFTALVERVKTVPAVAEYLASSASISGNPFGL